VSKAGKLRFLVDTGADISLIKSTKLKGEAEFDPDSRVRVRGVDGSVVQTYGVIEAEVQEGEFRVRFPFHLVNKQVDLVYDGILGKDFLQSTHANICYKKKRVTFEVDGHRVAKEMFSVTDKSVKEHPKSVRLPRRSEVIVKLPVEKGKDGVEGLIDKVEIKEGIYVASSLIKIEGNMAITSILNTRDEEVVMEIPQVCWEKYPMGSTDEDTDTSYVGTVTPVEENFRKSREEQVIDNLRLSHLNPEEKRVIENTCRVYQDIFYLKGDRLSCTNAVKHSIIIKPGTSPINTRPYRLPETQKREVDSQVTKLLKEGIITESKSPWNSPLLVIPKKEDASVERKWRLVVDFRKLNENSVGDAYPLPDITEILDQLGQSKYFSCLDMVMGYHQIEVEEKDREKTAFSTKEGNWEYKRLSFGLNTAPATFQRLMNTILCGLTGSRCFVFLDDVVVYAKSLTEHDTKLREVFEKFRQFNLKLQPNKCEFLHTEVSYLGHVITENGVLPDPRKVTAIENYPRPTNVKQLKSYLGMASYYRRFIPNFSRIAAPLHALLKADVVFEWTHEREVAFQKLRQIDVKTDITVPKL
jgi:hypothetical protein